MFQHVEPYAGDPILTLNEHFQTDPRPHKVNLSIGAYFDDDGRIPVMSAVRQVESALLSQIGPHPYLPMDGAPDYRRAVQELLFGAGHEALASGRVATIQTIGGSGGLKVGSDFLRRHFPQAQVWVSDPTWENHRMMFEGAGFTTRTYPYYDPATGGLRFEEMLAAVREIPRGDIVLLHACCHNPTGVDLNPQQWQRLLPVLRERELIPYLDLAYQGFGDGLDEDAAIVRQMTEAGMVLFVANSFSKSFSLYGERCGGLSVVCPDGDQAERVLGQMKAAIRRNYSSPPSFGARLVAGVLLDPGLKAEWAEELGRMRNRIKALRARLHAALTQRLPGRSFDYFLTQRGMFSYTGLTPEQVDRLRDEHAVYVVRSGRMCMAGLSDRNVEAVAVAVAAVLG